jgi:hypothetical protein
MMDQAARKEGVMPTIVADEQMAAKLHVESKSHTRFVPPTAGCSVGSPRPR